MQILCARVKLGLKKQKFGLWVVQDLSIKNSWASARADNGIIMVQHQAQKNLINHAGAFFGMHTREPSISLEQFFFQHAHLRPGVLSKCNFMRDKCSSATSSSPVKFYFFN
jgi:phage pi2 protein 07